MLNLFYYLIIALGINILLFIPAFIFKTDKLTDLSYSLSFIILTIIATLFNPFSSINLILTIMVIIWALRLGIFLFIRIKKMKKDKKFDNMRNSFGKFLGFWLLQGLTVWIILIPTLLFINNQNKYIYLAGIVIWLLGLIIETIADIQKFKFKQDKKNKEKFINIGIWKYSRHPNYFGEILCWAGIYVCVFLSFNTLNQLLTLVSPLFIIVLLLFVTGLPPLEKYADKKWGKTKEYQKYKKQTSILIPWFIKKN